MWIVGIIISVFITIGSEVVINTKKNYNVSTKEDFTNDLHNTVDSAIRELYG